MCDLIDVCSHPIPCWIARKKAISLLLWNPVWGLSWIRSMNYSLGGNYRNWDFYRYKLSHSVWCWRVQEREVDRVLLTKQIYWRRIGFCLLSLLHVTTTCQCNRQIFAVLRLNKRPCTFESWPGSRNSRIQIYSGQSEQDIRGPSIFFFSDGTVKVKRKWMQGTFGSLSEMFTSMAYGECSFPLLPPTHINRANEV